MSSRSPAVVALVLTALLGGAAHADTVDDQAAAPAERRRIVGILDVRGPSTDVTTSFEKSLEQQIDTKQYWLVPRARLRERLANSTKWTEGCLAGPCLLEVKVQANADFVLLAALTGSGTSFGFVVTLLRTDTGAVLSQEGERCDVCTLDEAMSAAILSTIRLLVGLPDQLPDTAGASSAAIAAATARATARAERSVRDRARTHRRVGLGLTLGGLAVAAAGLAAYYAGDKPTAALIAAGAGGGLAGGGILVLSF